MTVVQMILAAVLLLGPLIAIHEFGHFWVARRFGVKVLTYSIGFGPALWKRIGRDGVQYQVAAVPLGGYVRMLDSREADVAPEELPLAFDQKSPWVRMAIVAAGPLINLLLAVVLFWALFLPASEQLNTRIAEVVPASPAAVAGLSAGDLITAIDGQPIADWEILNYALMKHMGESGRINISAQRHDQTAVYAVNVQNFLKSSADQPLQQLGFYPWQPKLPPVIGAVSPNEAADRQGLQVGDRFVAVNGVPIAHWLQVTRMIQAAPEQALNLSIERAGQIITMEVMPQARRDAMGNRQGYLGVGVQPPATPFEIPAEYRQVVQYDPITALGKAVEKTWSLSVLTLQGIGKMISGLIGLDNLSGPITIAKIASQAADVGWQQFFMVMAFMSISLGVLNLLPIPMLDGGHLLYYFIEAVRGRAISERVQAVGLQIGFALLLCMMLLALFNDFSRLG